MALYEPNKKVLEYFSDTFHDFDKDHQERTRAWDRWNAMWRGVFEGGVPGGKNIDGVYNAAKEETTHKSRLYVNQTKQAVVSAVSNVMSILFQQSPPFVVTGRASELDDEMAELIKKVVWYFLQQTRFPAMARRYVTTAAIYGTAWGKVYMDKMRDARVQITPRENPLIPGEIDGNDRQEIVQEFPMIRFGAIDPYMIWPDPESDWLLNRGRGIFHQVWRRGDQVEDKIISGAFRPVDPSKLESKGDGTPQKDTRRTIEGLTPLARTELPLFDYWGMVPREVAEAAEIDVLSDELLVPVHCILLGSRNNTLEDYLLAERNPLPAQAWPFVHDIWEDVGHGLYGRGIPENTHGPQMAMNVTMNTRLDNKATAIQQILGVNSDLIEDPDDLKYRQNWVIRTHGNPREVLFPLSVPDLTASAHIEMKEFERMIEESSGVPKYVQGTDSFGSNRTASGINTVFQAATKFLRDITGQFENNLISETAKHFYQHALMFLPDQFLVNITEDQRVPQFRQIALQNIAADVDFVASGLQGLQLKEVELNNLIQFAQSVGNSPIVAPMINWPLLVKNIYTRFGFKDADKIILVPQQQMLPMAQGAQPPQPQMAENIGDILAAAGGQAG